VLLSLLLLSDDHALGCVPCACYLWC
jgi:hypothetical protein